MLVRPNCKQVVTATVAVYMALMLWLWLWYLATVADVCQPLSGVCKIYIQKKRQRPKWSTGELLKKREMIRLGPLGGSGAPLFFWSLSFVSSLSMWPSVVTSQKCWHIQTVLQFLLFLLIWDPPWPHTSCTAQHRPHIFWWYYCVSHEHRPHPKNREEE